MKGKVNPNREAIVQLHINGPGKNAQTISAIVDTGYNGALTLPQAVIQSLGLPRVTSSTATLADGSIISFDIHAGFVIWNGRKILIDIDEADTDPLIGMELLEGSELKIHVLRNGTVSIRPLP